jgi:hypothetical protein
MRVEWEVNRDVNLLIAGLYRVESDLREMKIVDAFERLVFIRTKLTGIRDKLKS